MKKVVIIFLLAVIAPSCVLAWLAVRSLRDQELVIDRQQTLLYQGLADSRALAIAQHVTSAQHTFAYRVEALFKAGESRSVVGEFDARLRSAWPLASVGFAVALDGEVLSPSIWSGSEARNFRVQNDRFLCSRETVEVYFNSPKGPISLAKLDQKEASVRTNEPPAKTAREDRTVLPVKETAESAASKITAEETNFRQLIGTGNDGMFARFLQDKLYLMFWHRASDDPRLVFGTQVNLGRLVEELRDFVHPGSDLEREVCVALLDDSGRPVARSSPDFSPSSQDSGSSSDHLRMSPAGPVDVLGRPASLRGLVTNRVEASSRTSARVSWRHPFAAALVGESLPHWEVAVYLQNPQKAARSATTLRLTLGLIITLLVLAIAAGSWLIVADLRRELARARQKTDFVSNVSHELKTPLTSIRMFTEMLAEDRVLDHDKRRRFLGIITSETARLTRLINNVLDFARIERGDSRCRFESLDLALLLREIVDSFRPSLNSSGFALHARLPETSMMIRGDRDAIAQILVNLLSNAEKYSSTGERKEISLDVTTLEAAIEVRVADRGTGVPAGCEEKIFEQFYRAHDSLSSGIQGSGLGLSLARRLAREHGGDVRYEPNRPDGSAFTLTLPRPHP